MLSNILERYRTTGDFRPVDSLVRGSSWFQIWRPRSTSSTRGPAHPRWTPPQPSSTAFAVGSRSEPCDGSAPGSSRHGPGSASAAFGSAAGLKPMTDETRKMPPFGSPKGEGRHDQASSEEPEESQVVRLIHPEAEPVPMPSDMGAGEIVRRSGFWSAWTARHRWPSSDRQPRLARSPNAAPTGLSDATKVGQPAYPLSYNGAGEGWPPPPLRSPRSSRSRGGRGRGLCPPSPVPVRPDA